MTTPERFRALALALPQVEEKEHFGAPAFRVAGKIFAQLARQGGDALVKIPPAQREVLRMSASELFTPDPQWGKHGWTHVRIGAMDEAWVEDVLRASWRQVAPRRLHDELAP